VAAELILNRLAPVGRAGNKPGSAPIVPTHDPRTE
jgi:hypothetical protein